MVGPRLRLSPTRARPNISYQLGRGGDLPLPVAKRPSMSDLAPATQRQPLRPQPTTRAKHVRDRSPLRSNRTSSDTASMPSTPWTCGDLCRNAGKQPPCTVPDGDATEDCGGRMGERLACRVFLAPDIASTAGSKRGEGSAGNLRCGDVTWTALQKTARQAKTHREAFRERCLGSDISLLAHPRLDLTGVGLLATVRNCTYSSACWTALEEWGTPQTGSTRRRHVAGPSARLRRRY